MGLNFFFLGTVKYMSTFVFNSTSALLMEVVDVALRDCSFILRLVYELNVLPLSLQITNICGNVLVS